MKDPLEIKPTLEDIEPLPWKPRFYPSPLREKMEAFLNEVLGEDDNEGEEWKNQGDGFIS